ncbi:NAD(P)-binding protein [Linnemannia elongata AG-77]|uniref:NAD(P)-binding protein n=1 Tax=Linnemannia elongata AG-77 TaxID=1314771 RepID=A0A197K5S9_9FUNG|nr:NAD(P)-binding protein [Linnemannia elongata AG-77]
MSPYTQLAYWKSFFHGDGYSHDQIPDLASKVAIVTGANSGLGYATTVALAAHGARVFLACRNQSRAQEAINRVKEEIRTKYPNAPSPQLEFLELDLGDMNKTRQAAQEFLKKSLPLHILVNNTGIIGGTLELSADGVESEFAVNHMGHYVFTLALLDRIRESQPARIVIISSLFHEKAPGINYDTIYKTGDTPQPHHQSVYDRYARSKLANVLFARALARRVINEPHLYVNACHPGYVSTRATQPVPRQEGTTISRGLDRLEEWFHNLVAWPVNRAVLTQLYLATSPEVEKRDIRGRYFGPIAIEIEPSTYARDEKLQDKLWAYSEKLANEKLKA